MVLAVIKVTGIPRNAALTIRTLRWAQTCKQFFHMAEELIPVRRRLVETNEEIAFYRE